MIPGIRRFFRHPHAGNDLAAEITCHIEEHAADLVRRGADPETAMRAARDAFGDRERYFDETLAIDRGHAQQASMRNWLASLSSDVGYAFRRLRGSPAFTLTAVFTLALGVGATVAVFSAVSGALLRPLPFAEADRIVHVGERPATGSGMGGTTSAENVQDWRRLSRSFQAIGLFSTYSMTLTGMREPQRVEMASVTPGIFDVFQVSPTHGRRIADADTVQGAPAVALVSYDFWQATFGGDPDVVGRTLWMNFGAVTVIGVLPRGFHAPGGLDRPLWLNFINDTTDGRGGRSKDAYARLKPGVRIAASQREMDVVTGELQRMYPKANTGMTARVDPVADVVFGDVRQPLYLLSGASALVLLLACANISNLLVVRGITRGRELAVRAALGAGRARIAQQMLIESFLLALLGCIGGLALAIAALRVMTVLGPRVFLLRPPVIDGRVLAFSLFASVLCTLVFGLAPVRHGTAADLFGVLKSGGRGLAGTSSRTRSVLALAQLAIAVVLINSSGLVLKSLVRVIAVDPGILTTDRLYADVWLPRARYDSTRSTAFYAELERRLAAAPGVLDVGLTSQVPLTGYLDQVGVSEFGGRAPLSGAEAPDADRYVVTPGYFRVVGVKLLRGRLLSADDRREAAPVAVVDDRFARTAFGESDAIGQSMRLPGRRDYATIVGVVGHVQTSGLETSSPGQIYISNAQYPWRWMSVVVHTRGNAEAQAASLARVVRGIDANQPIANVSTLDRALAELLRARRFTLALLGAFAAIALALASVGLYAVIACGVTQRRQEIGVRAALGASRSAIVALVLREGMAIAAAGTVLGLVASLAIGRLLSSLRYGVSPRDASVLIPSALGLTAIAFLACLIPARRAAGVDALEVLRGE